MKNLPVFSVETEEEVVLELDELLADQQQIILYNDEEHSFDFVIDSLVKICKHNIIQAEQCTYIVHYKGKCSVKKGPFEKLKPMCLALCDRGLTAEIE